MSTTKKNYYQTVLLLTLLVLLTAAWGGYFFQCKVLMEANTRLYFADEQFPKFGIKTFLSSSARQRIWPRKDSDQVSVKIQDILIQKGLLANVQVADKTIGTVEQTSVFCMGALGLTIWPTRALTDQYSWYLDPQRIDHDILIQKGLWQTCKWQTRQSEQWNKLQSSAGEPYALPSDLPGLLALLINIHILVPKGPWSTCKWQTRQLEQWDKY